MGPLLTATITLMALIVAPGAFFYYDVTPKVVVLLLGTAVALAWPRRQGAPRGFSLLVVAAAVWAATSTALSGHRALSLYGTNWRRFGLLAQLAVLAFAWCVAGAVAARPKRARILLRGIAAAGTVTAIYGIAQYFGWDPLLPKAGYHIGEGIWTIVRPPGTLGYVSYFATWLLTAAFLAIAAASETSSAAVRYAAWTAAALMIAAMLLTGTRAAMLGLAVGAGVWLAGRGFRIPRLAVVAAIALVSAGAAFYYSPAGWPMRSRARWFVEDPLGGARLYLWRDSAGMALRRPLGYGPEVFTAEFPRFESKDLARAYSDYLHESPHNILLDAWVSQGVPGVAILGMLCWIGLASAWRSKMPEGKWLAAGLAAAIVSQMFTVFTVPTAAVFYVVIAVAVGLGGESTGPAAAWLRWPLAAAFVFCAVRMGLADHSLASAQSALDRGDVATAAARYREYDQRRLPGTGSDLWFSRACAGVAAATNNPVVKLQALGQASAVAERATSTSEEPFNAWYNLSAFYAARNDLAGTERCLRAAIAARPNWFKPHWTLAQVLRLEERPADAETEAAMAVDQDGGKHPEVARTLADIRRQRVGQPW